MYAEDYISYSKPWVLIDKINSINETYICTEKNITSSDFFLVGHFPSYSIYPGVLLLEGVIQSSMILIEYADKKVQEKESIIFCRFLKPVLPSNVVTYSVELKENNDVLILECNGKVKGEIVIRATIHYKFMR
ncbi:3-hydroxyacyl-ACP dehydratase FabZ family protein [Cytobacillus praedii]|uniref:3-hydroxyacyl-ACP dehydratase FabZ family protein n=1 Tax=Cytobacillus praedii TaxID=1742358 RepID=UPI003F7DCB1C